MWEYVGGGVNSSHGDWFERLVREKVCERGGGCALKQRGSLGLSADCGKGRWRRMAAGGSQLAKLLKFCESASEWGVNFGEEGGGSGL